MTYAKRLLITGCLVIPGLVSGQMIANISEEIQTDFGTYQPYEANYLPNSAGFILKSDFSNVTNFSMVGDMFNSADSALLQKNHFTVKYSPYKQLYDIYNLSTWDNVPVFVTTDAVLHIYHVLFDGMLSDLEVLKFFNNLDTITETLITETEPIYTQSTTPLAREAACRNLAFLGVARKLLRGTGASVPSCATEMVDSELALIEACNGFHISPIFDNFSALDYSQFQPRGHYTKNDSLRAYFKSAMWYGWTIFTMEPNLFGDLSRRHSLQAILLLQLMYKLEVNGQHLMDVWEEIYEPTCFFVGKTDDPNLRSYKIIADQVYGPDFLSLSADSLSNLGFLDNFMTEARKLPEPAIPNWIYGSFTTYKGFRLMGQRFIPDSYLFNQLVDPNVLGRYFPKGLDLMAVLGSDRAMTLLDSLYMETAFPNYTAKMDSMKNEFSSKHPAEWAQNLYWNWLYCLMPLLYEKGHGYPFFMQALAWADKELLTALASWAELRHDTILYAKQSMTPCCLPPGPPESYVEPNPHLYARLASLVRFTSDGLETCNCLLPNYQDKLTLFEDLLLFLRDVSIKELENRPLTESEYKDLFCFGNVMKQLVSKTPDPHNPHEVDTDDMAVIADVHTDSNTDLCLEEGVGYPLEIYVIVNEGGSIRLVRGAIFSYYEFLHTISPRLTDEAWRELLTGDSPPELPKWTKSFIDSTASPHMDHLYSPEHLYNGTFTGANTQNSSTLPMSVYLHQNYPNPFNSDTFILFELPRQVHVSITIFNILGQHIITLHDGIKTAGSHAIRWNGKDALGRKAASGIYIYKLMVLDRFESKKMFLMR
jgi:hypothetical protein